MSATPPSTIVVRPGSPLCGTVPIAGAKNAVLKLLAATTLAEGRFVLRNVPDIADVAWMAELLEAMGMRVDRPAPGDLVVDRPASIVPEAPYELVEKMRASIVVLGPLVARCGIARVSLPGGDDFGPRPIDMHLRALEALGATIDVAHGMLEARADRLRGTRIVFEFPSVGATENTLMAAVLAEGMTTIENAAREPEIVDLADCPVRLGARSRGAGTSTIEIDGVAELGAADHTLVPDRIEAATYLAATAVAGGEVTLGGARADHMDLLLRKVEQMGVTTVACSEGVRVLAPERLRAVDVSTLPYPGLATDYKPLLVAALAVADGVAIVTENIFAGRFRYVDELVRMGADIRTEGHHAVVRGRERLSGARVRAHDIRAGAALVVAGLRAEGETVVADAHHIDRGYERFIDKLTALGASVERR